MRIKQLYCNFGKGFKEAFSKKYQMVNYTDILSPAVFFGCVAHRDLGVVYNHKGLCIIIWAGSDIKAIADENKVPINSIWIQMLKHRENIKHIAISKWIADDLDKLGIKYYRLPILPHNNSDIHPCPLGSSVYMYQPDNPLYNGGIYEKVKKNLPYNFIEATVHTYSREQLMEVYKDCFIGLRFTDHDGLSNTVCELGLMGRRVINNGDIPNCLPYETVEDVIRLVKREYEYSILLPKIMPEVISERVKCYLNITEDFLDTGFYG